MIYSTINSKEDVCEITCHICHTNNSSGAKFCANCGSLMQDDDLYCGHCGARLTSGARFCSSCGAPVSTPSCDPVLLDSKQTGSTDESRKSSVLSIVSFWCSIVLLLTVVFYSTKLGMLLTFLWMDLVVYQQLLLIVMLAVVDLIRRKKEIRPRKHFFSVIALGISIMSLFIFGLAEGWFLW